MHLLAEDFLVQAGSPLLGRYFSRFTEYIKTGKSSIIEPIPDFLNFRNENAIISARKSFRDHDYPKFDIIAVTTLFTFCWKETIETIIQADFLLAE